MNKLALTAISILVLVLTACGGGGGGANLDDAGVLTGSWSGSFDSSTPFLGGGSVSTEFRHASSGDLSGSVRIGGSPCLTTGRVSGATSGDDVSFGAVSGDDDVSFVATFTETRMTGTYAVGRGDCAGDSGTFVLTRDGD